MIQEIITYLIITIAVAYTLYNFYNFIIPSKNKAKHLCSGACSGCALSKNYNPKIAVKNLN